ncbi:MAG: carbamoyltransferase [Magnetococcales bacterium]|nr:carbamoyltransferase [Magnetococcales bacterium]
MIILGLSAFYHDSAAALLQDGVLVAAAQEERFTRRKWDHNLPVHAIRYCLQQAGITLDQVDLVGFYDKPLITFDRLLETYLAFAPRGFDSFMRAMPVWVKDKLLIKKRILDGLNGLDLGRIGEEKIQFSFHHHAHAASAFFPSPFERAAVLVLDGVGEWATTSLGRGAGSGLELLQELRFPHSLGMLYSAFTCYLGFRVNDGEYKVMGLAPYGEPVYAEMIREALIDLKEDGSFRLNMACFDYCTGATMINDRFAALFDGLPPRASHEPLTRRHMNLARSIQVVSEEIILRLARTLAKMTGETNLCMAGGVALNCVANGRLLRSGVFEKLWIQPSAGDAGAALGVAFALDQIHTRTRRLAPDGGDAMQGGYLGPEYPEEEIRRLLRRHGAPHQELSDEELFPVVAALLAREQIVGWFQGRMEFGPRALGNRSILGDARSTRMQKMLNLKIKYRESFRPFAPAVLAERAEEYFELDTPSPYMLLVADVRPERRISLEPSGQEPVGLERLHVPRSDIPAVTHVDDSARVQTVHQQTNPRFHRLLTCFEALTGCGVLVNTSFNIRDEPIVCSPEDAYRCFMGSEMDALVLGNTVLYKKDQA